MQFAASNHQYAELAGTAVVATSAATANALITLSSDRRFLKITNGGDVPLKVTRNLVDFDYLLAGQAQTYDLGANALCRASGEVFGVYNLGAAPTTRLVSALAM